MLAHVVGAKDATNGPGKLAAPCLQADPAEILLVWCHAAPATRTWVKMNNKAGKQRLVVAKNGPSRAKPMANQPRNRS
jgi:hypothetical protein